MIFILVEGEKRPKQVPTRFIHSGSAYLPGFINSFLNSHSPLKKIKRFLSKYRSVFILLKEVSQLRVDNSYT